MQIENARNTLAELPGSVAYGACYLFVYEVHIRYPTRSALLFHEQG